jgi:putative Ca2+/H+ antiporter (TMEM165/GDT1 family)
MVALSFLAVAIWTLKPDRLDDDETRPNRYGAFVTTTLAFFLAEMGDKTQIATAVLAAQYVPLVAVVAGSTLGMLIANLPVIALGARFADRLPLTAARWIAAAVFTSLALIVLLRG